MDKKKGGGMKGKTSGDEACGYGWRARDGGRRKNEAGTGKRLRQGEVK